MTVDVRTRRRVGHRVRAVVAMLSLLLVATPVLGGTAAVAAATVPTTYAGPTYGSGATAPSADKPQSKLWHNDGAWWALMATSSTVNIFELRPDHTWRDTGVVVDTRLNSTGDALWSAGSLYVSSRTDGTSGAIRVTKLRYSSAARTYTRDPGFPVTLPGGGAESVTADRDSLGRLWVTFTRSSAVWVTHSTTTPTKFVTPFRIPGADTAVSADDISAVISLNGKIGVMWTDQASSALRFAVHADTDPDTVWRLETPLQGTRLADDHVNLKSMLGDDQGRVHAAVKTSLGNGGEPGSSPSILVLSRTSAGTWTSAVASVLSENLSRPQLSLDRTNRRLYVLQSDEGGGSVYYKSTPLDAIAFGPGKGAPLIQAPGARVNNVSTAKDPVDAATGLVAIAADSTARRYFHAELALGGPPPPPPPPPTDTVAPTVTATSPTASATSVPVTGPVTATFSEPLSAATVTTASFSLTGPDGRVVPVSVGYDATALRAAATPSSALTAGTTYTATVTTAVRDAAGNPMAAPRTWSFTTAAAPAGTETVTLSPVADSFVLSGSAGTNFGSRPAVEVDASPVSIGYLRYDLSAYAGRAVQSATLALRVSTSGSPGRQDVKLVTDDGWTEAGLTFANRPALSSSLGAFGPTVVDTTYTVPLAAAAVQGELGQALSLGLDTTSTNGVDIASRETPTPPQLVLVMNR